MTEDNEGQRAEYKTPCTGEKDFPGGNGIDRDLRYLSARKNNRRIDVTASHAAAIFADNPMCRCHDRSEM